MQHDVWKKEEGPSVTQYSTSTNHAQARNAHPDWTSFIATAMFEGGQAFLKTISSASSTIDEAQLQADEKQADQRLTQAFDAARRDRANKLWHLLAMDAFIYKCCIFIRNFRFLKTYSQRLRLPVCLTQFLHNVIAIIDKADLPYEFRWMNAAW